MAQVFTTQREVRRFFWQQHRGLKNITPRRIKNYSGNGKMHNTDTRCAFCSSILASITFPKSDMISQGVGATGNAMIPPTPAYSARRSRH